MLFAACTKERSTQEPAAKAKLTGTWKLNKYVDETWTTDNVLTYYDEQTGKPGDSVIFTNDYMLHGYEDSPTGVYEDLYPYKFVNDSTLNWDGEDYVIRKLTATELYLHQEEMDPDSHQKDVVKIYLVR